MGAGRDTTVDVLRGFAIFTMVAANMAPDVLGGTHPLWFRFYGSFAAPLFILLAGLMVGFTSQEKHHGFSHFLVRGILLLSVGALVDRFIFSIYPFTTVDVLYLIGVSLPLSFALSRSPAGARWMIPLLIFLGTPFLQAWLGYADYPKEFDLSGQIRVTVENQTNIFHHWWVDGWFPLFPWLGFAFLGVALAQIRYSSGGVSIFGRKILGAAVLILLAGILAWWLYPDRLLEREGYSELFYPPTLGYIATSVGVVLLAFVLVDLKSSFPFFRPFQVMGECSLLLYVLHLALIQFVLAEKWPEQNLKNFMIIYLGTSLVLFFVALGVRLIKRRFSSLPFLIRFLLGS